MTALCMGWSTFAIAVECRDVIDRAQRLECYDKRFGSPDSPQQPNVFPNPRAQTLEAAVAIPTIATAADGTPEPAWRTILKDIKLRDELTPKGLGSNPALISLGTQNGQTFGAVRAAVTYSPSVSPFPLDSLLGLYGWAPYLSGSYDRSTLSTKPVNTLQGNLGLSGVLGNIDTLGFALYSNVGVGRKDNRIEGTTANTGRFDSFVVSDYLRAGVPFKSPMAWQILPRFGYYFQDRIRAKEGVALGHTNSFYGGLRGEVYPSLVSDRLRITGYVQRYVDAQASSGIGKTYDTYYNFSIDYLLYDPTDLTAWVMPSISLQRSIGADPLNSIPAAATTLLSLKLQLN